MDITFSNRSLLFLDILGFKSLIRGIRKTELAEILVANALGAKLVRQREQNERGTSFECVCFSDSIIASDSDDHYCLFNVIDFACYIQNKFLWRGILTRGGLVIDDAFHSEDVVMGEAVNRAYELESQKASFPRILLSDEVLRTYCTYLQSTSLRMPRWVEEFRVVKDQLGQNIVNPFFYDPDEPEYLSQSGVRREIVMFRLLNGLKYFARLPENSEPKIKEKFDYLIALGEQILTHRFFDTMLTRRNFLSLSGEPTSDYVAYYKII